MKAQLKKTKLKQFLIHMCNSVTLYVDCEHVIKTALLVSGTELSMRSVEQ